jgi:hypothetical protein
VQYEERGRRTHEVMELGGPCDSNAYTTELDYTYDTLGRLAGAVDTYTAASGSTDADTWELRYDAFGRGVEVVLSYPYVNEHSTGSGSGTTTTTGIRSETITYTYDCP